MHILATSAVRDASNSKAFVDAVEATMNARVQVLSGEEEAHYAALGVVAGIPDFTGLVGDLGGGSLELSAITAGHDAVGETHGLGVIRMQDDAGKSIHKARDIARERLSRSELLAGRPGGQFCAIGGTWRSLAKVHQVLRNYPLHMVQHYTARASDIAKLCDEIIDAVATGKPMPGTESVSSSRRELVPYGAAVLSEVLRAGKFDTVLFSALGVREGYLYGQLTPEEQAVDPLLQGAEEISILRSRSPGACRRPDRFHHRVAGRDPCERNPRRGAPAQGGVLSLRHRLARPPGLSRRTERRHGRLWLAGGCRPSRKGLSRRALAVRYMGLKHKSVSQSLMALAGARPRV